MDRIRQTIARVDWEVYGRKLLGVVCLLILGGILTMVKKDRLGYGAYYGYYKHYHKYYKSYNDSVEKQQPQKAIGSSEREKS